MPMVITPESELGKELAKWEKPYHFEPFPKMLYKAFRRPDGVISVGESNDAIFGGHPGAAEAWSKRCYQEVGDEYELTREMEKGWRESPDEALAYLKAKDEALSTSAAHRAHEDRNMGDLAKAEAAQAEAATAEHVAEVPEKPRQRKKGLVERIRRATS